MNQTSAHQRTVMVVEDFDDTRQLLRLLLERQGYYVLEANNGRSAVELAKSAHPRLILMDLSLPVLDGLSATRQIREQGFLNDVLIVAVTAHQEREYKEKALAAGCDDFVNKPLDFDRLEALLRRFMPVHREHSE
ncbi:MAG TPA: response regulator [Pyrinomonadaceae bacterium]|jgi:CheY-like chemotaxis protein